MENADQARMQMKMQFSMVNSCFGDCVESFREATLSANEKQCLTNCGNRGMQTMQIFGQISQQMEQQGGGGRF